MRRRKASSKKKDTKQTDAMSTRRLEKEENITRTDVQDRTRKEEKDH
jgi:hypothetical protein